MVSYTPLFTTLTKKGMTKTELRKTLDLGQMHSQKCLRENTFL